MHSCTVKFTDRFLADYSYAGQFCWVYFKQHTCFIDGIVLMFREIAVKFFDIIILINADAPE